MKFFVSLWREALDAHTPWLCLLALVALASVRDRVHRQRHFRAQAFFIEPAEFERAKGGEFFRPTPTAVA